MIRTINELHRSAKRLFELAKEVAPERCGRLLQLARLGLRFAEAQLRNPSLRPDMSLRMSADQYRAVVECVSAKPEMVKRARRFGDLAEMAELYAWPSSADAPFQVLTEEELSEIRKAPFELRQRALALKDGT